MNKLGSKEVENAVTRWPQLICDTPILWFAKFL